MKKFCIGFILLICCICTYCIRDNNNFVFSYLSNIPNVEYCYVSRTSVNETKSIKTGGYTFSYFGEYDSKIRDFSFLEARFYGDKNLIMQIINDLSLQVCFCESFEDIYIVYCYTPNLSKYCSSHGGKVNVQFAFCDGKITLGYPMIYTGY